MASTQNLNLAKPAGTDKALVSVINSNSDKIDAFAGTTNQSTSRKRGNLSAISNDTAIMDLLPGTYQNVLGDNVKPYLPTGYGVLVVNDSGNAYRSFFYTSTGNVTWYRICHKEERTWYGDWQELALNSDIKKIKTKTFSMGSSSDSAAFRSIGIPNGSFISALVTNQNYIIALPYTYNGMDNEYLGFFNINSMGSRVSGKFDLYIVYFE